MIRSNGGLIKIDKDVSHKRIDPLVATLGAFKLAQYHEFEVNFNKFITDDYLERLYRGGGENTKDE